MNNKSTKNICHRKFLYLLPGLEIGGAELQTINQLNYFHENNMNNFSLAILSNKIDDKCNSKLFIPNSSKFIMNIEHMELLSSKSFPYIIRAIKTFSKIILNSNADTVIAILLTSQFVARLTKIYHFITLKKSFKIVSYYRGIDYQLFLKKNLFLRIFNLLNASLAFFTDNKSIFISKAVKNDILKNFYVNNNNQVIHNSVPQKNVTNTLGKEFLKKFDIDEKTFVIVVPGIVQAASKGQFFFVNAFKEFVEKKHLTANQLKVIIAGNGSDFDALKSLIVELKLNDYFVTDGFMQNENLLSLFKNVNLVVVPSISEGFGNVVIEALMQETLVLASDTGGIPEIITDNENGLLFKSNNIISLVEKLNFIYENRSKELIKKQKMSDCYKAHFTLEAQINKILNFLEH